MSRHVTCGICTLKVSEGKLFDHLVNFHNWEVISTINDVSVKKLNINGQLQKKNECVKKIKNKKQKITMISSRGVKAPVSGKCDKCHVYHIDNWIYKYSDGSEIKLCRFCKGIALDKAKKRKKDLLDHCVSGSAFSGKRR
ncbi:hypothetical protein AAEX71_004378 [Yersinia enterocolitica]